MKKTFRTLEVSDSRYESANLRFLTVKTPNLRGRGDITVFEPKQAGTAALPLITLLHGVYGSHWAWSQSGGVHLTAQRMIDAGTIPPMIIAMPSDGLMFDGSGYLPHNDRDFENWIVDDVPTAVVEAGFSTALTSPRFIAGLSMGGYGALRLGAKYRDRYAAFAGHSSITEFDQMSQFVEEDLSSYGTAPSNRSVLDALLGEEAPLTPFRFDCGFDDPLIEPNRTLHRELTDRGIDHQYQEHSGGHDWPYWTKHIEDTLQFFATFVMPDRLSNLDVAVQPHEIR